MGEHGFDYSVTMSTFNEGGNEVAESEFDIINRARHYNRDGAIECIDEMEMIYGKEALMHFCLLSMHKYRYRAGLKDNGYQDLEKSDYYMRKYKQLKEELDKDQNSQKPHSSLFSNIEPITFNASIIEDNSRHDSRHNK